jgi:hypothetical protein
MEANHSHRILIPITFYTQGEQILHKILGKDATALYERYHRWVNEEK